MIPTIVHQLARTSDLSWEERRLVKRLRRLMPDWDYRLWTNDDQVRIVRERFPDYADRHAAIPFGVARADIARYVLMHAFGGFYLDTDYKLLRPFDAEVLASTCVLASEGADPQKGPPDPAYLGLGNAAIGSAPGYRFWTRLLDHIFTDLRPETLRSDDDVIEVTGPEAMTRFYTAHREEFPDIRLFARNRFFPPIRRFGTASAATPETYGVHLYWSSWRNKSPAVAIKTQVRRKLNGLLS